MWQKSQTKIDSKEKMEKAVLNYPLLPFFPNIIGGLSIEEMCAPGMLFGGNYTEGCWEWKGPVIRKRSAAYGKFFNRKAGFVNIEILPEFLNYRRFVYPVKEGSIDEMLLEIIRENDSLTSTELKQLIFGTKKRTRWDEIPDNDLPFGKTIKSKSLESPLQRLQMGGWIIISDFEYKRTRQGERYGWGVARYSTPEIVFPDIMEKPVCKTPEESLEFIIKRMKKIKPLTLSKSWKSLLK